MVKSQNRNLENINHLDHQEIDYKQSHGLARPLVNAAMISKGPSFTTLSHFANAPLPHDIRPVYPERNE